MSVAYTFTRNNFNHGGTDKTWLTIDFKYLMYLKSMG